MRKILVFLVLQYYQAREVIRCMIKISKKITFLSLLFTDTLQRFPVSIGMTKRASVFELRNYNCLHN